jgi:hypothetical protein
MPLSARRFYAPVSRFLGLFLLAAAAGHAGTVTNAHVTGAYCGAFSGVTMCSVYFDKKISGSPGCVPTSLPNEQNHRFQFRLDDLGKATLSLALSAQATGATVEAAGANACSIWGDTETLSYLFILPPNYPTFN